MSYKQTLTLAVVVGLECTLAFWAGYLVGRMDAELEGAWTLNESPKPDGPDGGGGKEVIPTREATEEDGSPAFPTTARTAEAGGLPEFSMN